MRRVVACLLLVFSVFALAKRPDGIKETIRLLNLNNQAQNEEEEKKRTEMQAQDPFCASEFCYGRNQTGGEAHSWSQQQIAGFIAGETLLDDPSSGTSSDSKGSD